MKLLTAIITAALIWSCSNAPDNTAIEKARKEILDSEKAFEVMVREQGFAKGFSYFADEKAVILRNDKQFHGKDSIAYFYSQERFNKGVKLVWNAQFVEVAASLDLGYTYGNYTYSVPDSTGQIVEFKGYFQTVWKKQPDGSWKYVLD